MIESKIESKPAGIVKTKLKKGKWHPDTDFRCNHELNMNKKEF